MAKNVLTWIFTTLMETIHVELSDERVDISVSEIFGEDMVLKIIYLFDSKFTPVGHPVDDCFILFVLKYFKALLNEIGYGCIWNLT